MKHAPNQRIFITIITTTVISVASWLFVSSLSVAQENYKFSEAEVNYPEYLYGSDINIFGQYGIWTMYKISPQTDSIEDLKSRRFYEVMDEVNGELVMVSTNRFIEADKMSSIDAIKRVGGIPLSLESLYVAFRMFELLPNNTNNETYATNLDSSIMALEGTMYLAAIQNEPDIYTAASGTRNCILSSLVAREISDISSMCIPTLRSHLYDMIEDL